MSVCVCVFSYFSLTSRPAIFQLNSKGSKSPRLKRLIIAGHQCHGQLGSLKRTKSIATRIRKPKLRSQVKRLRLRHGGLTKCALKNTCNNFCSIFFLTWSFFKRADVNYKKKKTLKIIPERNEEKRIEKEKSKRKNREMERKHHEKK